jgi:transposase InsO family protein
MSLKKSCNPLSEERNRDSGCCRPKTKRRVANPEKQNLSQPLQPNLTWSIDFMEDILMNNRKFRTFNIIDDYNQNHIHKSLANMTPIEFLTLHSKKIPYFAVGF